MIQLIKRYLKSGVMENGVKVATEEGSPQGGPLSPLLANVYLNEFDWEWLRHRIRAYIWKQWKKLGTKLRNLIKLGVPEYFARMATNSRRGYWFTVETGAVKRGITNERLARAGFFELSPAYESIRTACIGRAVYRTVRTVP